MIEHNTDNQIQPDRPEHLLVLSATSPTSLEQAVSKLMGQLTADPTLQVGDVCLTLNTQQSNLAHRLAVMGVTTEDLRNQLQVFNGAEPPSQVLVGVAQDQALPLAFLYSGQGSQYPGMTRDLYFSYQPFREALDRIDRIFQPLLEASLVEIFFDPSEVSELVNRTDFTQPAIFAVQCAMTEMWQAWGITPDAVAGHSIGEYAAAVTAGVMTLEDAARLVVARGKLMHGAPGNGAMGVAFTDVEVVEKVVAPVLDRISIAAINAPRTVTISGDGLTLDELLKAFKGLGVKSTKLRVSHAFHSPLMIPILDQFREVAATVKYAPPRIKFMSCLTGQMETDKFTTAEYWTDHIAQPVLFQKAFQGLEAAGFKHFIELGADTTLSGLGTRCSQDPTTMILPTLRKKDKQNWTTLLKTLGMLFVKGFNPDWEQFDAPFDRTRLDLS